MVLVRAPAILGTPEVGQLLTVDPGEYDPTPDSLHFQWYAGDTPVGTDGPTYRPPGPVAGKPIQVRVIASKPGYRHDVVTTTEAIGPVVQGDTMFEDVAGTYDYVVPAAVGELWVRAVGGSGGTVQQAGGVGAVVEAEIRVDPGDTVHVRVAGDGTAGSGDEFGVGGFNGGGAAGSYSGGGGASDLRVGGDELGDRILVAAGGGGATSGTGDDGAPGGPAGLNGVLRGTRGWTCYGVTWPAYPGTANAGGTGGWCEEPGFLPGQDGGLGVGGDAGGQDLFTVGGGGGAGYFGGGGGGSYFGSGAGGSSYVVPGATGVSQSLNIEREPPSVRIVPGRLVQTVAFDDPVPSGGPVGGSAEVAASADSGLPVTIRVGAGTTADACSVAHTDDVWTVTYDHTGTCELVATQAGDEDYVPAEETITFEVTDPLLVVDLPPTVSGTPAVDRTLTADPGTTTPAADSVAYQWLRDGAEIDDATDLSYTLAPADLDTAVSVRVTASKAGYADAVETSEEVGPIVPGTFGVAPLPTITGTAKVGQALTAHPGPVAPAPDEVRYQWYADGAPIGGATGSTLGLTAALRGALVTVRVTATRDGYDAAAGVSEPFGPVTSGVPPTVALTVRDRQLRRGQKTTLTWTSDDATALAGAAAWPGRPGSLPASGSLTVAPTGLGPHTYRIEATNSDGVTAAEVTVQVRREPARLKVRAPARRAPGRPLRVHAAGLDAGEAYRIRFGSRLLARGVADRHGKVTKRLTVPSRARPGRTRLIVVGSLADRVGHAVVLVRR